MKSVIFTLLTVVILALTSYAPPRTIGIAAHAAQVDPATPTHPFVVGQRYDCIGSIGSQPWRGAFTVDDIIGDGWLAVSAATLADDMNNQENQAMPPLRWVNIQHLTACGEPAQTRAVMTATTAITSTSVAAPDQINAVSFKTPEEAITVYMTGLAQNDTDQLLRACAIEEMSSKFDFARYTDRLQAMLLVTALSPAEYPFYAAINKQHLSAQMLNQAKNFAFALLSAEAVDGRSITDVTPERVAPFIKAVDPARLATIRIEQIGAPNPALMDSDRYRENVAKSAAVYGATESTERVVLFAFEDAYYSIGFTLLRYGDTWKISSQTSPLGNTAALGTPEQTTVAEFARLTSRE